MTVDQLLADLKDLTRRDGWLFLKPGEQVMACVKCQGLQKGEKVQKLGVIEIVSVRRERLIEITDDDVKREGFVNWKKRKFIEFYCETNGGDKKQLVTRIEFRKVGSWPTKI